MSKRKIYFRADAGADIGYGHFIRSLALADMLRENFNCVFTTLSPTSYQLQEMNKVCEYIPLVGLKNQFENFLSLLNGDEIVVLDNYYYDTSFQKQIKEKGCKLICIDDIHTRHFYCDVIFCPDPCHPADYSAEPFTEIYCGMEWAFLRKPFINNVRLRNSDTIDKVVVALGGADPYGLTDRVLGVLTDKPLEVSVIAGDTVVVDPVYQKRVKVDRRVSAEEIVRLFNEADLGIFSASTICNEALACKLPVAAGYYVDNQYEYYNYLKDEHIIYPLGYLRDNSLEMNMDRIFTSREKVIIPDFDYNNQVTKILEIFERL